MRKSMYIMAILAFAFSAGLFGLLRKAPAVEPTPKVPVESVAEETVEEYEWKGEKRKRTIRKVKLGGEVMEFVKVPKGSFLMGSPDSDKEAWAWEKPQHKVTFTKPLWVAKYPVTKGQFASFAKLAKYETEAEKDGKGGYGFEGSKGKWDVQNPKYTWKEVGWEQTESHPVVNVTWADAEAFCKWAVKDSKMLIRLLTEAEYEYANRGSEKTIFFTGDKVASLEGYANVADESARKKWDGGYGVEFDDGEPFTSKVGKYKPNGFGLHDMTGNVSSWCADWMDGLKSLPRADVTDPAANAEGEQKRRVVRGGTGVLLRDSLHPVAGAVGRRTTECTIPVSEFALRKIDVGLSFVLFAVELFRTIPPFPFDIPDLNRIFTSILDFTNQGDSTSHLQFEFSLPSSWRRRGKLSLVPFPL